MKVTRKIGMAVIATAAIVAVAPAMSAQDYSSITYDISTEESEEDRAYSRANDKDASISEMKEFLANYPQSKYADTISNKLAREMARKLNEYSTEQDFENALSYATDDMTKDAVKEMVKLVKDKQKQQERAEQAEAERLQEIAKAERRAIKRAAFSQNGGWVAFAWQWADGGYNAFSSDKCYDAGYYHMGFGMRIGNYRTLFQLDLGVQPGVMIYAPTADFEDLLWSAGYREEDDELSTQYAFHMPVYGKLRLNTASFTEKCRLFLEGGFYYNAFKVDGLDADMDWSAGIGLGWKNSSWTIYYKQGLNGSDEEFDNKYIGTTMTYYFR